MLRERALQEAEDARFARALQAKDDAAAAAAATERKRQEEERALHFYGIRSAEEERRVIL
jgi:hypothetical protein